MTARQEMELLTIKALGRKAERTESRKGHKQKSRNGERRGQVFHYHIPRNIISFMARPLRLELAGGLYHVTSRGDGRAGNAGVMSITRRLAELFRCMKNHKWSDVIMKDLTVRSNSSKSSGLKSRSRSCPYTLVA
jgi:hypothetical protein